jgi:hypothetical protein
MVPHEGYLSILFVAASTPYMTVLANGVSK